MDLDLDVDKLIHCKPSRNNNCRITLHLQIHKSKSKPRSRSRTRNFRVSRQKLAKCRETNSLTWFLTMIALAKSV